MIWACSTATGPGHHAVSAHWVESYSLQRSFMKSFIILRVKREAICPKAEVWTKLGATEQWSQTHTLLQRSSLSPALSKSHVVCCKDVTNCLKQQHNSGWHWCLTVGRSWVPSQFKPGLFLGGVCMFFCLYMFTPTDKEKKTCMLGCFQAHASLTKETRALNWNYLIIQIPLKDFPG